MGKILLIITSAFLLLFSNFSFSQKICKPAKQVKISVDLIFSNTGISESENLLLKEMRKKLIEKDLLINQNENEIDYEFSVGIRKAISDNKDKYIAIVVISQKLPNEIIEVGSKEEAMYKAFNLEKPSDISSGGVKVRQLMSEDYMREFENILSFEAEIISLENIDKFCSNVVDKFLHAE